MPLNDMKPPEWAKRKSGKDGPVVSLSLREKYISPTGQVLDDSGYGNHGTNNGAIWVPGPALRFANTGLNEMLEFDGLLGDYENVTVLIRIKFNALDQGGRIFVSSSLNTYLWVMVLDSSKVTFMNSSSTTLRTATGTLSTGVWYTIVGVRSQIIGNIKIYLDGVLQSGTSNYGAGFSAGATIAGRFGVSAYGCNCEVEYASLYNHALTAQEIQRQSDNPWKDYEQDNLLFLAATQIELPTGAYMSQIQKANLGAKLYNGTLVA